MTDELRGGQLYRYPHLLDRGLSRGVIRARTERGELSRLSRGVYGLADGLSDRLRAVLLRLPPGVVVGFETGAILHGFGADDYGNGLAFGKYGNGLASGTSGYGLASPDGAAADPGTVHVIVPAGTVVPRVRGLVTHEAVLPVSDPVLIAGIACAPASRCAVDLARSMSAMAAMPLLDMALRSGACTQQQLRAEVLRHRGLRGVCQARRLVAVADPRPECRQESQLRWVLIDGGLPAPEPQVWVPDEFGNLCFRLDLGYRRRRIGIEYDGESHVDRDRLRRDRHRMNWLAGQGWRMRYFTAADLYRRPEQMVRTVAELLSTTNADSR